MKNLSKLNAILGRNPKSSNNVKIGKNIAIGGSITLITQVKVEYMPSNKIPLSQDGALKLVNTMPSSLPTHSNKLDKSCEG